MREYSADIAIIGGGLGGLTLARILRVQGIEATVYDLDASPAERSQGGSLDLTVRWLPSGTRVRRF